MSDNQGERIQNNCRAIWGDGNYELDIETDNWMDWYCYVRKDYGLSFGDLLWMAGPCNSPEETWGELDRGLAARAQHVKAQQAKVQQAKAQQAEVRPAKPQQAKAQCESLAGKNWTADDRRSEIGDFGGPNGRYRTAVETFLDLLYKLEK
jgi:hypothetical protein